MIKSTVPKEPNADVMVTAKLQKLIRSPVNIVPNSKKTNVGPRKATTVATATESNKQRLANAKMINQTDD